MKLCGKAFQKKGRYTKEVVPFEEAVKRLNALGNFNSDNMCVVANLVEENGRQYQCTLSQEDFFVLAKRTTDNVSLLHTAQRNIERYHSALDEIREKVGAYLNSADKMPAVVAKAVASDELETIGERIIDRNENAAEVAKEYLNGFSFSFVLPEAELSTAARHIYELNSIRNTGCCILVFQTAYIRPIVIIIAVIVVDPFGQNVVLERRFGKYRAVVVLAVPNIAPNLRNDFLFREVLGGIGGHSRCGDNGCGGDTRNKSVHCISSFQNGTSSAAISSKSSGL